MASSPPEGARSCVRCGRDNDPENKRCVDCGFDLGSDLQRDYDRYRAEAPRPTSVGRRSSTPVVGAAPEPAPVRRKTNPHLRTALRPPTDRAMESTGPRGDEAPPSLPPTLDLGAAALLPGQDEPGREVARTHYLGSKDGGAVPRSRPIAQSPRRPVAPPRPDTKRGAGHARPSSPALAGAGPPLGPEAGPVPSRGSGLPTTSPALMRPKSSTSPPPPPPRVPAYAEPVEDDPDLRDLEEEAASTQAWHPTVGAGADGRQVPEPVREASVAPVRSGDTGPIGRKKRASSGGTEAMGPRSEPPEPSRTPPPRARLGTTPPPEPFQMQAMPRSTATPAPAGPPPAELNATGPISGGYAPSPPGSYSALPPSEPDPFEPVPFEPIEDGFPDEALMMEALTPARPRNLQAPGTGPLERNLKEGVTTYVDATRRGFRRNERTGKKPPQSSIPLFVGIGIAIGLLALGLLIFLTQGE